MHLYLPFSYSDLKISDKQQNILFKAKSLSIDKFSKVGLIGDNGSGKSSLLSFLVKDNPQIYSYVLPPTQPVEVYDWLLQFENWWDVLEKLEAIFKTHIALDTNWNTLSGGERAKIIISATLSSSAPIALLDEPTNHLDLIARKNFIKYILSLDKALVIATHDRVLLSEFANKIWEINNGQLNVFNTGWESYLEQKELKQESLKRQQQELKNQKKQMKQALARERVRAAKVSSKKYIAKLNIDGFAKGFFKNESEVSHSKRLNRLEDQLDQRDNQLEGLDIEKVSSWRWAVNSNHDISGTILSVNINSISALNNELIADSELSIKAGERIAIIGENGSGKSLLISALFNSNNLNKEVTSDLERKITKNLVFDYLTQHISTGEKDLDLQTYLLDVVPENIGGFGLINLWRERKRLLGELSAGQLVRVRLAKLSSKALDLLIVDEPTNNLDISSIQAVERGLNNYNGALIVVSHDVNFLKQLNLDTVWQIENKKVEVLRFADLVASKRFT